MIKSNKYYLGIDTSAYTTSVSILDENNNILYDLRKVLDVKEGELGLRQQDALFQHLTNLESLFMEIEDSFNLKNLSSVSVSSRPRNTKNSYMPVFLQGKTIGKIISKVLRVDYKEFSHQEGHIAAGLINNNKMLESKFLAMHISGGTTELLLVEDKEENLEIELIGGSLDISFGQLIDRIGVYLGLEFPSGKKLDDLGKTGKTIRKEIVIAIKDKYWLNISGMENKFKYIIDSSEHSINDISKSLFHTIGKGICNILYNASKDYNINNILITGGVASNSYLRKYIKEVMEKDNINICYPEIDLCTDNSVGIAFLGKHKLGHWR